MWMKFWKLCSKVLPLPASSDWGNSFQLYDNNYGTHQQNVACQAHYSV